MGGDADTIQAAGFGWRPGTPFTVLSLSVYRQVVDLADPAAASFVIPGGSSGDPASPTSPINWRSGRSSGASPCSGMPTASLDRPREFR